MQSQKVTGSIPASVTFPNQPKVRSITVGIHWLPMPFTRAEVFKRYKPLFKLIPHVDNLLTMYTAGEKLKDATKTITTQTYSSLCKYQEAWKALIQFYEDVGQIRPSNSEHASPSFLTLKVDSTALPHWVNDYCVLNSNTVLDSYPLPHIDDILANCTKGKIWSWLDMRNSFFQMCVHPDDIHLTVITTPIGPYEWTTMPQGLKNTPPIHQHQMNATLWHFIGKICHIYIDDIVIWSSSITQHVKHINMVMEGAGQCETLL